MVRVRADGPREDGEEEFGGFELDGVRAVRRHAKWWVSSVATTCTELIQG